MNPDEQNGGSPLEQQLLSRMGSPPPPIEHPNIAPDMANAMLAGQGGPNGMENKIKMTDPYGSSQEFSSNPAQPPQPPTSELPAVPLWIRQLLGTY